MSLDLVLISILLLKSTNGEAPPGETLAIVPELDTTNTAGVYSASSAYSNYQPTSGYTAPTVSSYPGKGSYYPSTRPYSVSSTYLPVIPVSTSYYTLAPSPTTSPDYGAVWAPRPSPVYGVPQPTWATQPWVNPARPWPATTAAWASGIQPWAGQPWPAQPWSAASPWAGLAAYGAPGYNYDNPNLVGIKPPL